MKYDGIKTETLLEKNSNQLMVLIVICLLGEGISYLLYKHIDKSPIIGFVAIFFFILVIFLCIVCAVKDGLPGRLKYVYERDDVPKDTVDFKYWCLRIETIVLILSIISYNFHCITDIIKSGYL